MHAALEVGQIYRGHTWPNPAVGCVLVKNGEVIAIGCTQEGGRPHAEMDALTHAGSKARGATAYITLEPCNHTSPTKPLSCCDALIAAGVSAVVVGMIDPDPRMMGKSIRKLRAAGLDVALEPHFDAAYAAHVGYYTRCVLGRPRVVLKLAHSRDGKLGLPGHRTPISSQDSWQRNFLERSKVDAVMIGIGTAITDDPQLTDRRADVHRQPIRIIVDSHARLPLDSKLVKGVKDAPVWLLCAQNANTEKLAAAGVRIIPCPAPGGKIDMPAALKILGDIGLNAILAEGGAMLAADLLAHKLVDEALIVEGTFDVGKGGIDMPKIDMQLRVTEKIGGDLWRVYDSAAALDLMRAFFSKSQKFLAE